MTNQLKWRLGKLPTSDEVLKLVNDKIITKEEAREILFNEEIPTERDKESLEQEIKFLKEIVEKLSNNNRTAIVEVIKEIQIPYYKYTWTQPYITWTNGSVLTELTGRSNGGTTYLSGTTGLTDSVNCAFTDIQTF